MLRAPVASPPKVCRARRSPVAACGAIAVGSVVAALAGGESTAAAMLDGDFAVQVRPLLERNCLECHGAAPKMNELDLARFASAAIARTDARTWERVIEQLEAGEMPPAKAAHPITAADRARLIAWSRALVDAEALARTGDPGPVKLRRLSNVEYDRTILAITAIDPGLARSFPADGAAGEGFTNTGEGASMSPVLLAKYADAAKQVARRAVLLPDGFRFSASDQARDWTDEAIARVRAFHRRYANAKGELVVEPYVAATLRHRERLAKGPAAIAAIARQEQLHPGYLAKLWQALNDPRPSSPLDQLRALWRRAGPDAAEPVAAFIDDWRSRLWKLCGAGDLIGVGHYNPWQTPALDPGQKQTLRVTLKPGKVPQVTLHLAAYRVGTAATRAMVRWERPRFETTGQEAVLLADLPEVAQTLPAGVRFGVHPQRGRQLDRASLASAAPAAITLSFPYSVGVAQGQRAPGERTFVVEAVLEDGAGELTIVQPAVATTPPKRLTLAQPEPGALLAGERVRAGYRRFRELFPRTLLYEAIVPNDTVVTLKLLHREDEPLRRLMLDDRGRAELDRLWSEVEYISRDAETLGKSFEVWYGFTTQDAAGEKGAGAIFASKLRGPIRERAERFGKELIASEPRHLDALLAFAANAWRRPLEAVERENLLTLYRGLRKRGTRHEDALRTCIARVLVSPAFLYRIEVPAAGTAAAPVDDWALASRLSFFLWAGPPDQELRDLAATGKLRDEAVLAAQARRMLADGRLHGLASEFGAAWLGVRGFDQRSEKSETLFPQFDATLRASLYQETLRFIEDLFRNDRPLLRALDADWVFVDERVARHYGIPAGGAGWRRVEAAGRYGRGGILALGTVLATHAGASRTSPILRGTWVIEQLLGDRLPRPPPDVPQLPETEPGADGLSMRQLVSMHTQSPACAGCHRAIDPFGFALEAYDAVGRHRERDAGNRALDLAVALDDGSRFTGIDGLRSHLLGRGRDRFARTFARKLLGYALGRAVELSDRQLVESLAGALARSDGGVARAVVAIVLSPQFRSIRGRDAVAVR